MMNAASLINPIEASAFSFCINTHVASIRLEFKSFMISVTDTQDYYPWFCLVRTSAVVCASRAISEPHVEPQLDEAKKPSPSQS